MNFRQTAQEILDEMPATVTASHYADNGMEQIVFRHQYSDGSGKRKAMVTRFKGSRKWAVRFFRNFDDARAMDCSGYDNLNKADAFSNAIEFVERGY